MAWFPPDACCVCSLDHPCLYDVSTDQAETANVAAQFPDIVQEMQAKLET